MNPFLRPVYITCGAVSLGLGVVGAFVPILPTTPFVLLAAFCFSKGRPEWHDKLRRSKNFGPLIRDWEERGAIPLRAKVTALAVMGALAGYMWWGGSQPPWVKAVVTGVEAAVLAFIWTRPSD